MGRNFKINSPFDTAMKLLVPTYTEDMGVPHKSFPKPADVTSVFFGSFKTYGGTESMSNGVYTVFETGYIETWYDPAITSAYQIYICDTGETWEIVSRPEDINTRHQYMTFKVKKVGGKP